MFGLSMDSSKREKNVIFLMVLVVLKLGTCEPFADVMNHKLHYKMGKIWKRIKNVFVDDDGNHYQTPGIEAIVKDCIAKKKWKLKCLIWFFLCLLRSNRLLTLNWSHGICNFYEQHFWKPQNSLLFWHEDMAWRQNITFRSVVTLEF